MKTKILMVALMLLAMTPAIQAKSSTKTVAHRGYWKCEGSAENSLTSLRKAHDVGCWGSELDIWLTSDGGLVVNHDPKTLDGLKIEETDFKTITKSKLKNGETVPSLKDYLKAGKKLKPMILVLELKTQSTPERNIELAKKVVDMVKSMKMEGHPNARVAYLNGDKTPAELKELGYTGLDYHQKVLRNNKSWIREAHDLGLTVNVWTVNKADDLQYFIDEAADFITTNEPELLLDLLKK